MIELTETQFDNEVRCLRNVAIKSSMVGQARITCYYKGKQAIGMAREYKGIKTYYINQ